MPTKEAPNLGSGEGREVLSKNELFREANKNPEEFLIPKTPQEIIPEEILLPPETQPEAKISQGVPPTPESPPQPETQIIEEEHQEQPSSHKQEPLKVLFMKKIKEKWKKREISKEEKRKVDTTLKKLWPTYAAICTIGALVIAPTPFSHLFRTRSIASVLWKMRSDPLFVASYLMLGVSKLGAILFYEKRYNIKFSLGLKLFSFWNFLGGGLAIPIEIAYTLGEGQWLVKQIRKRYFASPLSDLNKALEDFRSVFTK